MLKKIKKAFKYNKDKYENFLDDPKNKLGVFLSNFILLLVLLFVLVLILESVGNNSIIFRKELLIFDAFISIIFGLEYFYRLLNAKNKIKFFRNPTRMIDLFSFLPFFLGLLTMGNFLILLRLFRVFRVLRLVKKIPLTTGFIKSLKDYKDEYKAVFILFFIILFIGSFLVYYIEKDLLGTQFTSIPMSLWWGLVTMTTVGYGDMYPLTVGGKIIGSFLVFFGPLVLALASAVTIMVFMDTARKHELKEKNSRGIHCTRCLTKNPHDANFCYHCGKKLIKKIVKELKENEK